MGYTQKLQRQQSLNEQTQYKTFKIEKNKVGNINQPQVSEKNVAKTIFDCNFFKSDQKNMSKDQNKANEQSEDEKINYIQVNSKKQSTSIKKLEIQKIKFSRSSQKISASKLSQNEICDQQIQKNQRQQKFNDIKCNILEKYCNESIVKDKIINIID
ncbi:hypothetical protein PPERSA_09293 [Pseudocohnilembus persalinus]|uniref:Uncharacterized protein n=1 Tax=Pseudocohnilembus persalinus TaxID=266149 RepID=A0A0V0R581_PSEPJ|nr:hypothetical protein PPERSA_09293 [Pseudocohnilembus persalinus]|eukprot:KRX09623.1 hypothetical protein PPERSA_09293 [Pseudocohnilembus persalinus]